MRISTFLRALCVVAFAGGSNAHFHTTQAEAASCRGGKGIGVSRTVTLYTNGGARYGSSHGGHRDFLRHKEVVLTFDDGPIPATTGKVLSALSRHCTKATFFMVGRMAVNSPQMVKNIAAAGHTIGVHSYSHRDLGRTSGPAAVEDVANSIRVINKAAGRKAARFFRFPYLSENRSVNRYLAQHNYGVFAIDVDSLDYRMANPNAMVNRVMSQLRKRGKGIILLHDIKKVTARGVGLLLDRLNQEGYKIVHIRGGGGAPSGDPVLVGSNRTKDGADKPTGRIQVASLSEPRENRQVKKRNSAKKRVKTATKKSVRANSLAKIGSKQKKQTKPVKQVKKPAKPSVKTAKLDRKSNKKTSKRAKSLKLARANAIAKAKSRQKKFRNNVIKQQAAFRARLKQRLIIQ